MGRLCPLLKFSQTHTYSNSFSPPSENNPVRDGNGKRKRAFDILRACIIHFIVTHGIILPRHRVASFRTISGVPPHVHTVSTGFPTISGWFREKMATFHIHKPSVQRSFFFVVYDRFSVRHTILYVCS